MASGLLPTSDPKTPTPPTREGRGRRRRNREEARKYIESARPRCKRPSQKGTNSSIGKWRLPDKCPRNDLNGTLLPITVVVEWGDLDSARAAGRLPGGTRDERQRPDAESSPV